LGPLDALIHLVNLFLPAFGIAVIGASLAKLCWRRQLGGVRWRRLALWSGGGCAAVTLLGLLLFGRDGMLLTYAAMVCASALGLWWAGFVTPSRG